MQKNTFLSPVSLAQHSSFCTLNDLVQLKGNLKVLLNAFGPGTFWQLLFPKINKDAGNKNVAAHFRLILSYILWSIEESNVLGYEK